MKTQNNTVQLPDGQVAILFTEQPSKQLGIVDVATVKRLAQMLPSVPFYDIKNNFVQLVKSTNSLPELIEVIRDEFNFHTTVNLLQEYKVEEPENVAVVSTKM